MQKDHENFSVRDSGFVISEKYPFIGASPDGIASCDCCGEVCIEIKCPYCKRDSVIKDSLDSNFCLEKHGDQLRLKKTHQYYYQIQRQLFVCEKEYSDFVVWTNVDYHAERIDVDQELCKEIVKKSSTFFLRAILPELIGKLYSRPLATSSIINSAEQRTDISPSVSVQDTSEDSNRLICVCQSVYNPDTDSVIGCDNENCPYVWLHFKCVKIKRIPKGDWFCQECRKM
ncbi:uncharacterized protein LOC132555468 [Ylistrum balloti]|uniref:uncharacterized protein LOC132555468 n=1 Tax=Ylistrum balloti TaxID=509963 RepID=UPI002905A133|nr:uncharacterized protein LOC132555468 [Ylistrum balloti]